MRNIVVSMSLHDVGHSIIYPHDENKLNRLKVLCKLNKQNMLDANRCLNQIVMLVRLRHCVTFVLHTEKWRKKTQVKFEILLYV
jgi:hypothetical protein